MGAECRVPNRLEKKGVEMTTIREIAEQYGVSKSTARRWVLQCFPDASASGAKVELDMGQMHILAEYAASRGAVHEPLQKNCSEPYMNRGEALWSASEAVQLARYEAENEALLKRCESLEKEIERLHAALEREQMQARGFWSRLGQKLLGGGDRS